MDKYLFTVPDLCTGCNCCCYACSAEKLKVFQPTLARLDVVNFPARGRSVPLVCLQCSKPACLAACPEEAIIKHPSGVVEVLADQCSGCGLCAEACPYGMIDINQGRAYKCDACGGDPACVKECEPGALVYAAPDRDQRKIRGRQIKTRETIGTPRQKRQQRALRLIAEDRL